MASKKLRVIYIPGLGDSKVIWQRRAIRLWQWYGVEPELFQMKWADTEPWDAKFARLLQRIDEIQASGQRVGLVGASAGASAVINAFAARQSVVVGCVLIAGKVNRPEVIGQRYRDHDPAFVRSAYDCSAALETLDSAARQRILSIYGFMDETVYKPDSRIPGARNRISPTFEHALTIGFQLLIGAPFFLRFMRRVSR